MPCQDEKEQPGPGCPWSSPLSWVLTPPGSLPAPDLYHQALTFEGQLDPGGGEAEAMITGVGSPPAQSQQGGPEEDTEPGHGGHTLGRQGRGESGGGRACQRVCTGRRDVSVLHSPTPRGGNKPHISPSCSLACSILRGGMEPAQSISAELCPHGGGAGVEGAQFHLRGCQAKCVRQGKGGAGGCSTLLQTSRQALPR